MSIATVMPKHGARKRTCAGDEMLLTISRPELLIDGSDRDFRAFLHGMLAFSARLETVRRGFASIIGVTGIQYTILMSINYLEQRADVSVSMIAEHLHLTGAFVTTETGKLLNLGLLTKRPDGKDRRRVCLSITRKGCDLLERLAPTQEKVNDIFFEFLDAPQFRRLRGMVDQMTACGDRAVALLHYLVDESRGTGTYGRWSRR